MPTHIEAEIVHGLFNEANGITLGSGFVKAWEGVPYDPTGNNVGFVRFSVLKNDPINPRIRHGNEPIRRGIFQASVFVPDGAGIVQATEQAGIIRDAFARGTRITSGNVTIRIDDEPTVGPAIQEEAWLQIPVSVPFIVYP
jgi:hypothetical protein